MSHFFIGWIHNAIQLVVYIFVVCCWSSSSYCAFYITFILLLTSYLLTSKNNVIILNIWIWSSWNKRKRTFFLSFVIIFKIDFAIMFCFSNETSSSGNMIVWEDGGFSLCFYDTLTTSILFGFIFIFGTIQYVFYK